MKYTLGNCFKDLRVARVIAGNSAMKTIYPKVLTDDAEHPVAVQIDYSDWLRIKPIIEKEELAPSDRPTSGMSDREFEELLGATAGTWTRGDGLEYQMQLREEWTRPWETSGDEGR